MRLFTAIPVPDDLHHPLESLRTELPDAWWVASSLYHVTLQFVGADIHERSLPGIIDALQKISAVPFDLTLTKLERFKTPDWSGFVYMRIADHSLLSELQSQIVHALTAIGLELEREPDFLPHITLVYPGEKTSEALINSYLQHYADSVVTPVSFHVNHFALYETVSTPTETRFVPHAVFSLKPEERSQ